MNNANITVSRSATLVTVSACGQQMTKQHITEKAAKDTAKMLKKYFASKSVSGRDPSKVLRFHQFT